MVVVSELKAVFLNSCVYITQYNKQVMVNVENISCDLMSDLLSHYWPAIYYDLKKKTLNLGSLFFTLVSMALS